MGRQDMRSQRTAAPGTSEVNVNSITNGMTNRLSEQCGLIDEKLTGCFERYLIVGDERMIEYLIFTLNDMVL
jgi:hypothetical protein